MPSPKWQNEPDLDMTAKSPADSSDKNMRKTGVPGG
jgi:hypothetical protein